MRNSSAATSPVHEALERSKNVSGGGRRCIVNLARKDSMACARNGATDGGARGTSVARRARGWKKRKKKAGVLPVPRNRAPEVVWDGRRPRGSTHVCRLVFAFIFSVSASITVVGTRNCRSRSESSSFDALLPEWLPSAGEVAADLAHVPELPAEYDAWTAPWRGYELHFYSLERVRFFNGFAWSRASARAWHLPLGAVAAYALMIPLLRRVRRRVELRAFAQCWNFGLALFSAMGFCACAPVLLTELYRNGFYFTCCAPAPWYGGGVCGLFVALFIYSKFAELAPPRRPDEARAFFFSPRGRARRSTPPSSCWRSAASSSSTGGTTRRSCSTAGTRTARRSRWR